MIHTGLASKRALSYGKQMQNVAKVGCARVAFPIVNGGKRRGAVVGRCSLVALGSLVVVRGSRGHSGAVRCSSFLGEGGR